MGGVVGAQAPQSGGAGTGKFGGMANQGGGSNPFQQFQAGQGLQQAGQQTQQQQPFQNTFQQQPFQNTFQQQPFQGQQPDYAALFRNFASMFGNQQIAAPRSNYSPAQSANNFQLRNTYQFNPATDPSRQYAARVQAEADQKAADAAKAANDASTQVEPQQQTSYDMGSPGNARGGRISSPDKKIRAALLTAKGVQAKAVPGKVGGGRIGYAGGGVPLIAARDWRGKPAFHLPVETVIDPKRADQIELLPGGHVRRFIKWGNYFGLNQDARAAILRHIEAEINPKPNGIFWRMTNNKNEPKLAASGQLKPSRNHAEGFDEKGVSVADGPHYIMAGYNHGYPVSGQVIGSGSDGELLLDPSTIKVLGKIKTTDQIQAEQAPIYQAARNSALAQLGWTPEHYRAAINHMVGMSTEDFERHRASAGDVQAKAVPEKAGGGDVAPALPSRVTDRRIPELQDAADMVAAGQMGPEEYHAQVGSLKPVRPYTSLPPMATREDLLRGLNEKSKQAKIGAEEAIPEGHPVGLRLDIPAYNKHGVWAPTIHEGHGENAKPIAHAPFAHISNPVFSMNQKKALQVARGAGKTPFAKINGFWKKTSPEDAQAMAQEYLNHPEWRQVGMDPERHSFFYDRETRQPVVSADEALQIGPLVLAKNPQYGSVKDFQYEQGGRVGYAGGGGEDDPTVQKALGLTQQAQPSAPQMAQQVLPQAQPSAVDDHPAWIPTRLVTSKKAVTTPGEKNIVDLESMRQTPKLFQQNVDLVRAYPNTPTNMSNASHDDMAEHFINHVKNNLLSLHDAVPEEIRSRSKLWYDGARNIVDQWSKKYNLPDHSIAAALAALSPQKDWYQNVSLAERVLDGMRGKGENFYHGFAFNKDMENTFNNIEAFAQPKYSALLDVVKGKSLGDIGKLNADEDTKAAAKALWLRLHDETYNDRSHRIITPEGNFGDFVKTMKGENAGTGWGSLVEIGKAIRSIEAAQNPELISALMGEKHKVRNFYNNILAPRSPNGDVTIDTHAVAAGLYRPLSGKSLEVAHNFANYAGKGVPGAAGSAISGIQGTYPLYAEAYRRAAKERGILPREMQSITWEAVRGLFPESFKTAANSKRVDAVWNRYKNGEISQDNARRLVDEIAGGIRNPTWVMERGAGPNEAGQAPNDAGILFGRGLRGSPSEGAFGGTGNGSSSAIPAIRSQVSTLPKSGSSALIDKALQLTRKART